MKILFQWDDNLNIGIEKVDEHHRKLVDLINQLHDAMLEKKTKDVMVSILGELLDYTIFHFGFEETYFEKFGYQEMESHKKAHESFINKIAKFKEDVNKGSFLVSIEMMNFLVDWLIKHIQGSDPRYVPLFRANGLK